ncbi:MAG: endolytic transglycosylase MltG [Fibrobacterota bacterium]|jgi:UPF0755 protein
MRRLLPLLALVTLISVPALLCFMPGEGDAKIFRVARGEPISSVARRLESEGVVKHRLLFRAVARLRGLDRELRPGRRTLPADPSLWSVVDALRQKPSAIKVSIPEGRTCWDIGGILEHGGLTDSMEFARLCEDSALAREVGIPAHRLEGYLFPDTYLFDGSESPKEIVKIMVKHFRTVWKTLDTASSASLKELGPTGLLTLASIVEREAAVREESPLIAGVFYGRLKIGMTLGADPTVRYALRKFTGGLTVSDLAVESPYNTRKFPGLPPGPISNPGREALAAALFPNTGKGYLYFVGRDDGSRKHDFASDYNDFLRSKRAAARLRAMSGQEAP